MNLNADHLLAIKPDQPGRLFPRESEQAKILWRKLCNTWHPDRNPDPRAAWVFAHIQDLYLAAKAHRRAGLWDTGSELVISTVAGTTYRLRYIATNTTDMGQCFIGRRYMAYLTSNEHAAWAQKGYARICSLTFRDVAMREAMALQLPAPVQLLEGKDYTVMVLRKPADFVTMSHLQRYLGGAIPPRHVAWMVSGLLNIACYLQWAAISHMAIDQNNCLVSPKNHGVALTGGWWCAEESGAELHALPARSMRVAPPDILHQRIADSRLDALLIRQTGLELLGSAAVDAPPAMLDYLNLPGSGSAVTDYEDWQRALWASFGERRFSKLAVEAEDVYAMS